MNTRIFLMLTAVVMLLSSCQATDLVFGTKEERGHALLLDAAWESYQDALITEDEHNACMNDVNCDIVALELGSAELVAEAVQTLITESEFVPENQWPDGLAGVLQDATK